MTVSEYLGEEVISHNKSKEELAMWFITSYSYIDGEQHKMWVLDQVARILMDTPVVVTEASWTSGLTELRMSTGAPSEEYLAWLDGCDPDVVGIAP